MSLNRIQKLLYSEYSSLDDVVLVESPFVEITKKGLGLRQVHIGLTPRNLIFAIDEIKYAREYLTNYWTGQLDPELETMKLISIFPIELVSLSVFQRRRRRILKARFHNGDHKCVPKISYFELGGLEKRTMFWNVWCERVRFLSPNTQYNSISEASIGSSTSSDSIYPVYTKVAGDKIWQYYDHAYRPAENLELGLKCALTVDSSSSENQVKTLMVAKEFAARSSAEFSPVRKGLKIHRFGEGVDDQCGTDLFLPIDTYLKTTDKQLKTYAFKNFDEFVNQCAGLWCRNVIRDPPRHYRFCPCPEFLRGVGLQTADLGVKFNVKMKRTWSLISVIEEPFHHLSPKNLMQKNKILVKSQSAAIVLKRSISNQQTSHHKFLYFWTTDFRHIPDPIIRKYGRSKAHTSKLPFSMIKKFQKPVTDEKLTKKLQSFLRMNKPISVWSLDSNTLSSQLTTIDVNLFLMVSVQELRMIKTNGSARNCKNFTTWLTFSHRVSCLVATQTLHAQDTKSRARLVCRFIIVCDKCHHLGNRQSARSVLLGLMSPAVYRLYATWDRVRRFHSTAYRVFKQLCGEYKHSSLPDLKKPPYLPSASFLLDIIFGNQPTEATPFLESTISTETPGSSLETSGSLSKIMHLLSTVIRFPASSTTQSGGFPDSRMQLCSERVISSEQLILPDIGEAENVLRASQIAARLYDQTVHIDAQEFLLRQPYLEHLQNFQLSLKIEPPK